MVDLGMRRQVEGYVCGRDERAAVDLASIFPQKKRVKKKGKREEKVEEIERWEGGRSGFFLLPSASLMGVQKGGVCSEESVFPYIFTT